MAKGTSTGIRARTRYWRRSTGPAHQFGRALGEGLRWAIEDMTKILIMDLAQPQ